MFLSGTFPALPLSLACHFHYIFKGQALSRLMTFFFSDHFTCHTEFHSSPETSSLMEAEEGGVS